MAIGNTFSKAAGGSLMGLGALTAITTASFGGIAVGAGTAMAGRYLWTVPDKGF